MRKIYTVFLAVCCTLTAMASELQIGGLTCDYRVNPVAVENATPRFSWQLYSKTPGLSQQSYQILVASTAEDLAAGNGDCWNSSVVTSDRQTLIPYSGKALESNRRYFWKVKATDSEGIESDWSEPAQFVTALLKQDDWNASSWIGCPDAKDVSHLWFRKNFTLSQGINEAYVNVASAGYHELYVNGVKANDYVMAPAQSRLDKRVLYITYDIASLLKEGNNTIAVWYGNGWSRFVNYVSSVKQGIRVLAHLRTADGGLTVIGSGNDWKASASNSEDVGKWDYKDMGTELIHNENYVPGWNLPDFDDSSWASASSVSQPELLLTAQSVEPTRILDTIQAVSAEKYPTSGSLGKGKGISVIDFGKNFTGWVRIKLSSTKKGQVVKISIGDDPKILDDFIHPYYFYCAGDSTDVFCNRFNDFAGQYVKVEGLRQLIAAEDAEAYVIGTDVRQTGDFKCSNELYNQIYSTDLWTYRVNLTEGFVSDCPHRERLGYGEVATATSWGIGLPNYAAGALYTKNLQDWIDTQQDNGCFYNSAPQMKGAGGAMWCSAGLSIARESFQTYGDTAFVRNMYEPARRWLDYLDSFVKDGVLTPYNTHSMYFIGDWSTAEGDKEYTETEAAKFFNNCVYVMNLRQFIRFAEILGKESDIDTYTTRLNSLIAGINNTYYHADGGYYSNGLQVPQAFALWQDIVPADRKDAIESRFNLQITKNQPYLGMGSSGLTPLLHYLTETPKYDSITGLHLDKTNRPSYGYFIATGESAWPEYWSGDVASKMHTCYTGIASWFMKSLAGFKATEPGYKEFAIHPAYYVTPSFLQASMESLYGKMGITWRLADSRHLTIEVDVPVNTQAVLTLPDDSLVTLGSGHHTLTGNLKYDVTDALSAPKDYEDIEVYPTVFDSQVNIRVNDNSIESLAAKLVSIDGIVIMNESIPVSDGQASFCCPPGLPSQLYLLELTDPHSLHSTVIRRLIKH